MLSVSRLLVPSQVKATPPTRRSHPTNLCSLPSHFCVAGTLAAGIQSGIGNVVAGSLFAGAQATAMGAGIPVLAQVIGGTVTGAVGLVLRALA